MSTKEAVKFGEMSMSGKDIALPAIKYDRIAIGNRGEMYLASVVCETHVVKAARAILCGGAKATIQAARGKVRRPSDAQFIEARNPGNLYPTPEGYAVYVQKLNYGLAHAMFVTRTPGFMPVVSEQSLWLELNDTRFTTPLLREWLPYIEAKLREQDLLEDAQVFNAACGLLTASTDALDAIVSDGIKNGSLRVGPSRAESALEPAPAPRPYLEGDIVHWVDKKGVGQNGEIRWDVDGDTASIRHYPANKLGPYPLAHKISEVPVAKLSREPHQDALEGPQAATVSGAGIWSTTPPPTAEPAGPKSWKVACIVTGESGPSYNGCRYKTREAADAAGDNLFMRWTMMKSYTVEPSDDEPNY